MLSYLGFEQPVIYYFLSSTDLQMRSLWKQQPCYLIIQLEQQVVNKALKQKQIGSKIITLGLKRHRKSEACGL